MKHPYTTTIRGHAIATIEKTKTARPPTVINIVKRYETWLVACDRAKYFTMLTLSLTEKALDSVGPS